MSRFFKRVFLPVFLGYSLLFALAKFRFFQYGYIPAAEWMGRFLLLAQIPAFPITRSFNSLVLNKIFGFSINFTTYTAYSNFPQSEGFFNLANDLALIILSATTYILYFYLWRLGSQKLTRKSLSFLITALFLISYLIVVASGLFRYLELRREGWWKACPEIDSSSGTWIEIPSRSQIENTTCEWLHRTAPNLITLGLGWFLGLPIILKFRLFGGKSLADLTRAKWLLLIWLFLILAWILSRWYFNFYVYVLNVGVYFVPLLLPISWYVVLKDLSRSFRASLAFAVLSLFTLLYILVIISVPNDRPFIL